MPYSVIKDQHPVDRDWCAVSIVHDLNARDSDYYNGFIILERIDTEYAPLIELFELIIEENGQPRINHTKLNSVESLKKLMFKKDCYASSFSITAAEANILVKNITSDSEKLLQKSERSVTYARVKKPGFFNASTCGVDEDSTSFEWARSRALDVTSLDRGLGKSIPSGIGPFTKVSEHIGDLSSEKDKCLVM